MRADLGRKLADIRSAQHTLDFGKRDLNAARQEIDLLKGKLSRQGDAEVLKTEVERRDQEIAKLNAEGLARSGETARLRALVQRSEQTEVQLERRVAELEASVAEGNHRIEMLKRDLNEKTERLRRLSGLNEG